MRSGPAVALLLLATAGCVAPPPDLPSATGPPGAPFPSTLHLTPDLRLAASAPGAPEARFPLAWGWAQWLDGTPPPVWSSGPGAEAMRIMNASVTFRFEALRPTSGTPLRPELTAWWGVDDGVVHHAFLDGPDALARGETHEATIPLEVPLGGLVVPEGASVTLRMATYYVDDGRTASVALVLGGATPARLDVVAERVSLPAVREETLLEERATLTGGRCLSSGAVSPNPSASFPLEVGADALGLRVLVERTGGMGPPDVDFAVLAPSGDLVGAGQGPGPLETIALFEPNVRAAGPGIWTLLVYNCTPQASDVALNVALLAPPGSGPR